jgi:hypothetical protein
VILEPINHEIIEDKTEMRKKLEQDVADYLAKGGKITQLEPGEQMTEVELRRATYEMRRDKLKAREAMEERKKRKRTSKATKETFEEWKEEKKLENYYLPE